MPTGTVLTAHRLPRRRFVQLAALGAATAALAGAGLAQPPAAGATDQARWALAELAR